MVDSKAHGVRRKLLARAFSKTYLRQHWEGVVRGKASLAVDKMRAESGKEGSTDMLKWWTLMATDVATHLMFGDSFHMIEEGKVCHVECRKASQLTARRKPSISRSSNLRSREVASALSFHWFVLLGNDCRFSHSSACSRRTPLSQAKQK